MELDVAPSPGPSSPFFSVVIPTYNRRALLERCLATVLEQTFSRFEILVVDDRSDDDTLEALRQLRDPRLRILSNQGRKGAAAARNVGIDHATGEWVTFLDSDDRWLPRKLEVYQRQIAARPSLGVWYSGCRHVDAEGRLRREIRGGHTGDHYRELRRVSPIHAFSSVAVRKDLLLRVGGFDESLPARQDVDLYFRLAPHTPFGFIDEVLTIVSFGGEDRISASQGNRMNGWLRFYLKHRQHLPLRDRFYHHKRIFYHAMRAGSYGVALRFAPGAVCSRVIR